MEEVKELLKKGDVSLKFVDGNLEIHLNTSAVDNVLKVKSSYVIDAIEEAIPGDQKSLAAMLKGALGVA